MKTRTLYWSLVLAVLAAAPARPQSDAGAESSVGRIMAEALKPSPIQHNLEVLTDRIGGRVPGTSAMQQAFTWGENALRAAGADNVAREPFTIPTSWAEGATEVRISGPENFHVRAVSIAWAPATKGTLRAPVVDVGMGAAADFAKAGDISGKVILVHSDVLKIWDDLFQEYLRAPPVIDAAIKGRAAAIAFTSSREHDILYRHIENQLGYIEKLPMVLLAREDSERVARLLASGNALQMEISAPNHVGGPIQAANIVGELRGSRDPGDFVVLGAHLDSWELGTGALDNGCNAALVIDALRAIKAAGVRPRRSIRFVLFSGEEQGVFGSMNYVRAHRAELDHAAGAIVFDEGTGAATGFSLGGRKDLVAAATRLVAPFAQFGATRLTTDAFVGTDNFDFLLEGVPNFVANQKEANYLVNYHATSDTYDKVDFEQLKKHVAIAAALAFELADSPQPIGPRQDRAQVQELLQQTGLDQQMKIFGFWPQWESGERGRAAR